MDKPVAIVSNAREYTGPGAVAGLIDAGLTVIAWDRQFTDAEKRRVFEMECPGAVISTADDAEALTAEVIGRYGQIDTVVSNTIGEIVRGRFEDLGVPGFLREMDNYLFDAVRIVGAVVPHMRERKSGRVIIISSGAGLTNPVSVRVADEDPTTPYTVAREAENALTRCLAVELAPYGISVNAIAPWCLDSRTFFPSEIGADDPAFDSLRAKIPFGRFGKQSEIGALIGVLGSGRAAYVTGQIIAFSGAAC